MSEPVINRPPPILTSEPGSFARRTFEVRIPKIVEDTIAANEFPDEIVQNLHALRAEILSGAIAALREQAPDAAFWNDESQAFIGRSWLDVPWYWAESFFYRRMLEATRYFQPGAWHARDPYANQKAQELEPAAGPQALVTALRRLPDTPEACFGALLHGSVWGNRADLSYNVSKNVSGAGGVESEHANLVVDDTASVWQHLAARRGERVDFICDNAGRELLFDLALADHLLREGLASAVKLHVKAMPFFVSDTMIKDVTAALDALAQSPVPELQTLGTHLLQAREAGRLTCDDNPYWVTCKFFFEMPLAVAADLASASLVLSKGDANYRRLLGDCHWMPATPFETTVAYFPAPLAALRTLKAELIVGLRPGQAEQLKAEDPDWMVNGQRGLIQFKDRP